MRVPRPDYRRLMVVAIVLLLAQSCALVPGVRKNEDIKSSKREKFHELNDEVFKHLKRNDLAALKPLFSDGIKKAGIEKLVDSISRQLKANKYDLMDEYYAINKYADFDTIRYSGSAVNRYGLMYPYVTFEEYFAYFLPKDGDNKYMISLCYGNFKDGWKLINISLAPYTIDGRTGPELYQQAREDYDKTNYPAAAANAKKAMLCMKPSPYWQYADLDDATRFNKKTNDYIVYYHFPFILLTVSSGPMIIGITDKYTPDGVFPLVTYMTHYDIKNPDAVKKENAEINIQINNILRGLQSHYSYMYYAAYNQNPAKDAKAPHLDMKVKPANSHLPVMPE